MMDERDEMDEPCFESALAIIIGRGGSKGLPGKNRMNLAGRPMICHTIEDALQAALVDHVIVSTDCDEIAAAANGMGVEVIRRPSVLASDSATVDAAVRHAVQAAHSDHSMLVILYANVPIRPDSLIDDAIAKLHTTGCDSVQSYSSVGKNHPFWMVRIDDRDQVSAHVPNTIYRRQDLPPLYLPNGGVIAVTRESLFNVVEGEPHAFLGKDRRAIIVPEGSVIDVDSAADFALAEAMLQMPALQ